MATIDALPPELWHTTCGYLSSDDLKTLRLSSREFHGFVDPLLFESVAFNLDPGGLDKIEALSCSDRLARQPRTLILRRAQFVARIWGFDDWTELFVQDMTPTEAEERFEAHQREFHDMIDHHSRLATVVNFGIADGPMMQGQTVLWRLIECLKRLSQLKAFIHRPEMDSWICEWQDLTYRDGAMDTVDYEHLLAIDDIQLAFALHVIMRHTQISSLDICCRKYASIDPIGLEHMVEFEGRTCPERRIVEPSKMIGYHMYDEDVLEQIADAYISHFAQFATCLGRLSSLQLAFNTHNEPDDTVQFAVTTKAYCLSEMIVQAHALRRLDLTFRDSGWTACETVEELRLWNHVSRYGLDDTLQCSLSLVTAVGLLSRLERLSLSLTTTSDHLIRLFSYLESLHHLQLNGVCLIPQCGTWERVLSYLVERKQLRSVRLRFLLDQPSCVPPDEDRALFDPADEAWVTAAVSYEQFEGDVYAAIRGHGILPPLTPVEYCRYKKEETKKSSSVVAGSRETCLPAA